MSQIRPRSATTKPARVREPPRRAQQHWLLTLPDTESSIVLDEALNGFVSAFHRLHRRKDRIQTRSLRFVRWPAESEPGMHGRHVWEVAYWPSEGQPWTFICWSVDEPGLWMRGFARLRDALAYLRSEPSQVMKPHRASNDAAT